MAVVFKRVSLSILILLFGSFLSINAGPKDEKDLQLKALEALVAEVKHSYAMFPFKKKSLGVDLNKVLERYRSYILKAQLPEEALGLVDRVKRSHLSRQEAQQILVAFAAEFQDGHFNIIRSSKDKWTLGIHANAVGKKLFVTGTDSRFVHAEAADHSIEPGDEILEVNHKSVHEIAEIRKLYSQTATPRGIYARALESILNVDGRFYLPEKEGETVEILFRKPDGTQYRGIFQWINQKRVDEILDDRRLLEPDSQPQETSNDYYFGKRGVASYFKEGLKALGLPEGSVFDLGAALNSELEEGKEDVDSVTRLEAYVIHHKGKNIGVLRIPSYNGGVEENELAWLERIIPRLENSTDMLILDHLANGGGSNFYSSQFLRFFAKQPMKGLTGTIRLSESMLHEESDWEDNTFRDNFPEDEAMDLRRKRWFEQFYQGNSWVYDVGVHDSQMAYRDDRPAGLVLSKPGKVYTKPVLILNDQRSASNGDMVPAVLQLNDRALVMGERSSGLGGFIFGMRHGVTPLEMTYRCTFCEARRPDGLPIENVGTLPDIMRPVVPSDLNNQFKTYATDALEVAHGLLSGENAPSLQQKVSIFNTLSKKLATKIKEGAKPFDLQIEPWTKSRSCKRLLTHLNRLET